MRMLYPGQQRERVDDHESMQNKTLFEVEVSFFQLVADPLVLVDYLFEDRLPLPEAELLVGVIAILTINVWHQYLQAGVVNISVFWAVECLP